MNILVTGISGFIGRALVSKLLAEKCKVTCVGRTSPEFGSDTNFIKCDLSTGEHLVQIPWSEYDCVVHLASAGVKASRRLWQECLATNVVGLQHLLNAIERSKVPPKLICAGTFYEKAIFSNPIIWNNPYIATKWTASQILRVWSASNDKDVTLAHFFQIFGDGDEESTVLSYIKSCVRSGRVASLGSGTGLRDWLYIEDAIAALWELIIASKETSLKTTDIGSGNLHSIREAAEVLVDCLNASRRLLDFSAQRDRADQEIRIAASLNPGGWRPRYDFQSSITKFSKT